MKLKNKKTGEIGWLYCDHISVPKKMTVFAEDKNLSANHWDYASLAELNEEWEDYEEPKEHYWVIDDDGMLVYRTVGDFANEEMCTQIDNYFETREEAELAIRKLKAWKRLKDKGFRFEGYDSGHNSNKELCGQAYFKAGNFWFDIKADLDLLFGGEE